MGFGIYKTKREIRAARALLRRIAAVEVRIGKMRRQCGIDEQPVREHFAKAGLHLNQAYIIVCGGDAMSASQI